jgi:hypothetical protein
MRQNVFTYKEYADKHLPQYEHLWQYEVDDFDENAYDEKSKLDKLESYLKDLVLYAKHLTRAAFLRQSHYEDYIDGTMEEDEGHQIWRLGMNQIAEDAWEKLTYWQEASDGLFKEHVKRFERSEAKKAARIVDLDAKNVDFTPDPIPKAKPVRPPKISQVQKNIRRKNRIQRLKTKNEKDEKLLDKMISHNEQQDQLIENISDDIIIDPEQIFSELQIIMKNEGPSGNSVPCILAMYKNKILVNPILLPISCEGYKKLAVVYASLYFKNNFHNNRIEELHVLSRAKCFVHHFLETVAFYCCATNTSEDNIIDMFLDNGPAIYYVIATTCLEKVFEIMDQILVSMLIKDDADFDRCADIIDALKFNLKYAWAEARLYLRTNKLLDIITIYESGNKNAKRAAEHRWATIKGCYPDIKTCRIKRCCSKGYVVVDRYDVVSQHKQALAMIKKRIRRF